MRTEVTDMSADLEARLAALERELAETKHQLARAQAVSLASKSLLISVISFLITAGPS